MINKIKTVAADWLPDLMMVGGAGAVSYGVSLVYFPAGYIVGGVFGVAAGVLLARGGK